MGQRAQTFKLAGGERAAVARARIRSRARARGTFEFNDDALARADRTLELVGRALRERAAVVHDHHAVADLLDLLHVVAGVDHRRPLGAQALDAAEDGVAALRVHGHSGLVEEDELRLVGDAAGDVEAAQQSTRELAGTKADEFLKFHELDRLVHERATAGAVAHVERAEVVDVLTHGELVDDRDLLRHDADPALEVVARGRHGLAEQADAAAVVGEQGEHAVDARGLARAVGAQQAEDLALVDVQVEVVEGEQLVVAFDEPLDGDDVHGSSALPQFRDSP